MKQISNPILVAEYESAFIAFIKAEYMLSLQELMGFINSNDSDYENELEYWTNQLIKTNNNKLNEIKQYVMTIDEISKEIGNNLKELIK
ncbi:hypothetical protein [Methanobrevibacter sp.]